MAAVTVIDRKTRKLAGPGRHELAVMEAARTRARVQMGILCRDFFDATDDFLFTSGSKGQFTGDSNYLQAMRELRTKQSLFEEALLELTASTLFVSRTNADGGAPGYAKHLIDRHAEIYAMLEIDLALQAMGRKADKYYAPSSQQLDALFARLNFSGGIVLQRFVLVEACLWAFGEAQRVFALPLDIRLVVIKLFEQHFLLQLETLFQDVIELTKHVLVNGSVDEQFLIPWQLQKGAAGSTEYQHASIMIPASGSAVTNSATQTIELTVDVALAAYCALPNLPEFVAQMLRCQWRTVLFLIGMHRGCSGSEWHAATATMQKLAECTSDQAEISTPALAALLEQIRNGFAMLQLPESQLADFEQQVHDWLHQQSTRKAASKVSGADVNGEIIAESSLSPSGKKILDNADLDEIANLLGTDHGGLSKSAVEKEFMDCLPAIDRLREDTVVDYKIDGIYQSCYLQKNPAKPGMFNITDRHTKTTISRSRLGLAISLHQGALKLPAKASGSAASPKKPVNPITSRLPE